MSGFISKAKAAALSRSAGAPERPADEPAFSIQPHPAKSNDPADLQPAQPGGGLRGGAAHAFDARPPHVVDPQTANSLGPAATREELRARQAELNK